MNKPKQIKVVIHYFKDDTDFGGDYSSIDLYIDDKLAIKWGDGYHDKGDEKCEGFLEALKYIFGDLEIKQENIADSDY